MPNFRVGDIVKFPKAAWQEWLDSGNDWYKTWGIQQHDTFEVISTDSTVELRLNNSSQTIRIYQEMLELYSEVVLHQSILDKIKYLNKRYLDRKLCHA